MSGLFSSLSSTSQSLQTQSLAVQQAGKNIANINNPYYSRQRIVMGSTGAQPGTAGTALPITAIGVTQVRDVFIDRQMLGETAYLSSLETQDFRLRQALANLGDSIDRTADAEFIDDISEPEGGLRGSIDSFFNAFESFSARPNDATSRQVLFQSAENLVDTFHRLDQRFELMEEELNAQMDDEVGNLNRLLKELDDLNLEIARLEVGNPKSALDLRDTRQQKLEQIAEYGLIEVSEIEGGNGQVQVTMQNEDGDPEVLLGPGSTLRELQYSSETSAFSVVGSGVVLDIQAGRLPALVEVQTEHVSNIRSQLDSVANSIATEVNELYYQAFAPAGTDPAVPEISFFQQPTPPPSAGGTGTVTASSLALYSEPSDPSVTDFVALSAESLRATATEISGANELALAISDLATAKQSAMGGLTYSSFATKMVTELGQDIRNVQNRMEVQEDVKALLETRRGEISGVSMDEEVSNMIQFQRAYQATSRFFNVLSEMLDTLINSVGR